MGGLAPAPQEGTKGGWEQRGQQVQTQPEAKEAAARCQLQASYHGTMTIFCSHCHRPLQAEMSCLPRRGKQAPSASKPFR